MHALPAVHCGSHDDGFAGDFDEHATHGARRRAAAAILERELQAEAKGRFMGKPTLHA